jgi:S-adenosylmethionine:tRNA ribosyltransferase-isomerase
MKHPSDISIQDFTYDLPHERIAAYPLEKRDESKLLIFKNQTITEDVFKNLDACLEQDSILVFNDTKVIHARLHFKTSTSKDIEVFCLEPHTHHKDMAIAMSQKAVSRWNCLVGNLKQWKEEKLVITTNHINLIAKIVERKETHVIIDFFWEPVELTFAEMLDMVGVLPIPPYLKRESEEIDQQRYQTIYASNKGSVAAPTAGLHFTEQVFKKLNDKSIQTLNLTLHVGAGTFKPVKSETMQHHDMHAEWIEVTFETIKQLSLSTEKNIIAVGTTSLRTLETLYWMGLKTYLHPNASLQEIEIMQWDVYQLNNTLSAEQSLNSLMDWMQRNNYQTLLCKTQILIAQPYELKMAKGIITNFHQPQSTLLLLISAIVGDKWKDIYDYALKNNFRFLSYGDSSLLLK